MSTREEREGQQKRGFHRDPGSAYPLPNDTQEHSRLGSQHEGLIALMHNKPFHCPVDVEQVKVAVDVGCGTGVMTLLLAEHFPNAVVYGIDFSPVPGSAKEEAKRSGDRVHFIEGNIFDVVHKHPALGSGTVDFVFHRALAAGMESYMVYLQKVVVPLLKPGGWVEMHDAFDYKWYKSDPQIPGSAICVSEDWLWVKALRATKFQTKLLDHFDTIVPSLQILDFEEVNHKLYKAPWAPVEGKPETEAWAAYAPDGFSGIYQTSIPKAMTDEELQNVGEENLKKSIRETVGTPSDIWWAFAVVWARAGKPS